MLHRWSIVVLTLLLILSASTLLAGDPVSIGAILASPETYYFRKATLQGTARQVKPIDVFFGKCGYVHNAYTFILDDGTGAIEVEVGGSCRDPDNPIVAADGDTVIVVAIINRYIGGSSPPIVRASAIDVRRVGK